VPGTKILWGQIILVVAIVVIAVWAATEWTAWRLGFQPQLGRPWFELWPGIPVYLPPSFFWWWYAYDAYAPRIFLEGAYIAASGGFISIAVAIAMSVWRAREIKNVTTYGSARWATAKEIRAAGLCGPNGVVLGRWRRDYLRHDGPEHVLCFAPTRSGKGVGLVVPIRLILNQIGRRLTEDLHAKAHRHRLLLMLEFPALCRLDFFESALAFMAGYGLKSFLIAQSLNQIEKVYGPNNAILDNCHVRVSFATNDERTAIDSASDDWSRLPPPPIVRAVKAAAKAARPKSRDPANAGIRQEPGLPRHEDIAAAPKSPQQEFAFGDEQTDDAAARAELDRLRARGLARQAAMDPGDGLGL
jgi:type IV secretory pathway TraG/TraD family ATPase VirD4